MITTGSTPKAQGVAPLKPERGPNPADSLPMGVKSSLRTSSQHKRMVSAVLHLKKESGGHKNKITAYNRGIKAFPKLKG